MPDAPNRDRVLMAASTFDEPSHGGTTYTPRTVVLVNEERAEFLTDYRLAEPLPAEHADVTTHEGLHVVHYGGGYYCVARPDGRILEDRVRGKDAALDIADTLTDDDTD